MRPEFRSQRSAYLKQAARGASVSYSFTASRTAPATRENSPGSNRRHERYPPNVPVSTGTVIAVHPSRRRAADRREQGETEHERDADTRDRMPCQRPSFLDSNAIECSFADAAGP